MKNKKETICAVVVTYNRKKLLIECLKSLLKQTKPVQGIYLIDNASTDGTPKLLLEKRYIKELPPQNLTKPWEKEFEIKNLIDRQVVKLHYVRMHENTGGAGGFHEGVKRAYKKGYDWLWLMDDDIKPTPFCLEELLNHKKLIYKETKILPVALTGPRFFLDGKFVNRDIKRFNLFNPFLNFFGNNVSKVSKKDLAKQYFKIEGASFEGLLINAQIIKKIGFPDKRFFIFGDDTDYCLRLVQYGDIYYIPQTKFIRMSILKNEKKVYKWKDYYKIRNLFYLKLKYSSLFIKIIRIPYELLKLIVGKIIKKDVKSILVILKAFRDALIMKYEDYNYF